MAMVSLGTLLTYEGQTIRDICPHGFDASNKNHCAHFVAHVLQLTFGMTCARLVGHAGPAGAANVRVHELFAECPNPKEVLECPTRGSGLIFVSEAGNFRGTPIQMRNVKKKHIGIVIDGTVWHYSNPRDRVIRQSVAEFLFHYPRQTNALWWADPPMMARPAGFATSA
jgi:hypothetical protein